MLKIFDCMRFFRLPLHLQKHLLSSWASLWTLILKLVDLICQKSIGSVWTSGYSIPIFEYYNSTSASTNVYRGPKRDIYVLSSNKLPVLAVKRGMSILELIAEKRHYSDISIFSKNHIGSTFYSKSLQIGPRLYLSHLYT